MGVAALVLKVLSLLGIAFALFWLGRAVLSFREAKGRKGRTKGSDRRTRRVHVPVDRRQGPRRKDDIAEDFLKDLDKG